MLSHMALSKRSKALEHNEMVDSIIP